MNMMNHNILCFSMFFSRWWMISVRIHIVLLSDRLRDVDHFSVVNSLELKQHHQTSQFQSAAHRSGRESLRDEGKETWPQPAERYARNVMFVAVCQGHNCNNRKRIKDDKQHILIGMFSWTYYETIPVELIVLMNNESMGRDCVQ
jgi:hypothetical protein